MIIGFGFNKITVERKAPLRGKVEIKYNLAMEDVAQESIALAAGQMALRMSFKFAVEYEPKIGVVELMGSLMYMTDEKTAKSLLDN